MKKILTLAVSLCLCLAFLTSCDLDGVEKNYGEAIKMENLQNDVRWDMVVTTYTSTKNPYNPDAEPRVIELTMNTIVELKDGNQYTKTQMDGDVQSMIETTVLFDDSGVQAYQSGISGQKVHISGTKQEYDDYAKRLTDWAFGEDFDDKLPLFDKEAFLDGSFEKDGDKIVFTASKLSPEYKDQIKSVLGVSSNISGGFMTATLDEDSVEYEAIIKDGKVVSAIIEADVSNEMSAMGYSYQTEMHYEVSVEFTYGIDDIKAPEDWDEDSDKDLKWTEYFSTNS